MFRVRIHWEDSQSQIGAFEVLENAKKLADERAEEGYKVFGGTGQIVYDPTGTNNNSERENHKIVGIPKISANDMVAFVKEVNPNAQDIEEITKSFVEVGKLYQIRGDIAFCQSIIETGWFRFDGGTAVTPDQHNYAGLGVTTRGKRGNSFSSVREGVTAQIQHLFAYATTDNLPENEPIVDQRFHLVQRGSAPHWEDLSMRWAMNEVYGEQILAVYNELCDFVKQKKSKEKRQVFDIIENVSKKIIEKLKFIYKR